MEPIVILVGHYSLLLKSLEWAYYNMSLDTLRDENVQVCPSIHQVATY